MSRIGHWIDNGAMENFQGIMKDEIMILYNINSVEDFIEAFAKYMKFYIYERPQKRYLGKIPNAERYSIPKNNRIDKYWASIAEKQQKNLAI